MNGTQAGESKGTRVIALVGPAGAGKTSLAEAMLFAAGASDRLGSTANGSSIGDSSPESRQRGGSTELNLYNFDYLGDQFAILDIPGSVGFSADGAKALALADVAIVVVDPDPARAPLSAPALRTLDELGIPHLIFVNRIDQAHGRIRDLLSALQPMSVSPLIARQIPIWDGERIGGFVDLALERAFKYRPGKQSERIEIPAELQSREIEARTHMLEQLADHDDELLEQLLMDQTPSPEKVVGRAAVAQGVAPRNTGAAARRRPPRRHRSGPLRLQDRPWVDRPPGLFARSGRPNRGRVRPQDQRGRTRACRVAVQGPGRKDPKGRRRP